MADALVLGRNLWMAWREGACRTLAVYHQWFLLAVDLVLLDFPNVMRDVVHEVHSQRLGTLSEHAAECLAYPVHDHLPVGPCEVRRRAHGTEILLTFGGFERHAG